MCYTCPHALGRFEIVTKTTTTKTTAPKTTAASENLSLQSSQFASVAASNKLGDDIKILEVQALIGICDYFVIITGKNARQVKAISEAVEEKLNSELNVKPIYVEGLPSDWLLMDYGDIVIHIFTSEARQYYNLERLWSDCPEIEAELAPG